jgi:hypothetical protein
MDLVSLVTSGVHEELRDRDENLHEITNGYDGENPDDVPAVSHRRGLAPFVFVPFTEVSAPNIVTIRLSLSICFYVANKIELIF